MTMPDTTKTLRPYQVRLVTDVCRATEDVLVEQPTGSGKTVEIVTLVAMHLGRRFSHAVNSAPQTQIEFASAFFSRDSSDQCLTIPSANSARTILARRSSQSSRSRRRYMPSIGSSLN